MMGSTPQKKIFNIPAGQDFARILAEKLLQETKDQPEKLSSYLIFLPTRRACRVLQDTFLELCGGKPLLLPHLNPLGDIEEEDLSLNIAGSNTPSGWIDIPPGITPLRRKLLLARLIGKMGASTRSFDQSLLLADALGRFLDQLYIEDLDLSNLDQLVPEEFASHWQITTDFLKILSLHWPEILKESGAIDSADRRNRLIRLLNNHWKNNPPTFPVIAAGSTGSIPATAELLGTISGLPHGCVILPGLDKEMDEENWTHITESHPQFGLKQLLVRLDIDRTDIKNLNDDCVAELRTRRFLANEMMRPAETAGSWTHLATNKDKKNQLEKSIENLSFLECANENEEASVIALSLRETLENKGKTAVLITPDRTLAHRVATACTAWNIKIDDSGGKTLEQTPIGIFLRLVMKAHVEKFSPVSFLALCKHPFFAAGIPLKQRSEYINHADAALRGLAPSPGWENLRLNLGPENPLISAVSTSLQNIPGHETQDFSKLLEWYLETAENMATLPGPQAENILWAREDGIAAAKFFSALNDETRFIPPLTPENFINIIEQLMRSVTVRPSYGTHPRLRILGQLEARLVQADLVILGGLNEGTWPPGAGFDPWMSRPMRGTFGLPAPERAIGMAAHDFVQAFCAPRVILTRARIEKAAPTVPARWLQRLKTVLEAAHLAPGILQKTPLLQWVQTMHRPDHFAPIARPAPSPPLESRPTHISATRVETWLKDPYSIYARYILELKKIDPLEKHIEAAEQGTLLHNILHSFVTAFPDTLPENADAALIKTAREELKKYSEHDSAWSFWEPRFARTAAKFINIEKDWRKNAKPLALERTGSIKITLPSGIFTLTANADRIDRLSTGGAIIDYKSGGTYTKSAILSGDQPQLALEALILADGGFEKIPAMPVTSLSYWKLTGSAKAEKPVEINDNIEMLLKETRDALQNLAIIFSDPKTPYLNLPNAENLPRFNDYEHLARVREWGIVGDFAADSGSEAA